MVMLLTFETFYLVSVLIKIKTLCFYTNVRNCFCNQFWDLLFENFYQVFKTSPKVGYLIDVFLLVVISLSNQIFRSRYNTLSRVKNWRDQSPRH